LERVTIVETSTHDLIVSVFLTRFCVENNPEVRLLSSALHTNPHAEAISDLLMTVHFAEDLAHITVRIM